MTARMTAPMVRARKRNGAPLVMLTAYDAPSARIVDQAGADIVLVGDTVAMVVLGYDDTLQVGMEDMVHHVAAVARARPSAMVVGDLPWMSYHVSREEAVRNAARLIRAGAQAVKLEGGCKRLEAVSAIIDAEIPVMGHIGLTPQSVHQLGGYRIQGKGLDDATALVDDAVALAGAGSFAIGLECVPGAVGKMVTDSVDVPVVGIGAGPHCDGQVLVFHDLLGLGDQPVARFVRQYATLRADALSAVTRFAADVRSGNYPSEEESYYLAGDPSRPLDAARH
ncbi:MAG: 3-methyl-2-oxobutanoate hydroxymethyltransferase [Acidimicrobiia bacterium]